MERVFRRIAEEIGARVQQVEAAVALLDDGATVPFIARYRKEATGALDDTKLRTLQERLRYLRELEERRAVILRTIGEQGKLTPELEAAVQAAETKVKLEDLYLPYKPKRKSKAQAARQAGLEPLALALLGDPNLSPEEQAAAYVNEEKGVPDVAAALEGARQILMEQFAEVPELIGAAREYVWGNGVLQSRVAEGKEEQGVKYADYFNVDQPMKNIPSHRALALFRGRREGFLKLALTIPELKAEENAGYANEGEKRIAEHFGVKHEGRPADDWLRDSVKMAWHAKMFARLQSELEMRLREMAEEEAIKVFGRNLEDLLLAAPAGPRVTMGLDPGYRTGVKVAIVDLTGKLVMTATIYPHQPKNQWEQSIETLAELCRTFKVDLVSVGNGTASRETDRLISELIAKYPDLNVAKVLVSEAGASVYSASEVAAQEFPNLDVSLRGAVSIARRLQDPLAELVKIEPKSIGVGQYQHDVSQAHLSRVLDAVVEDCVNAVGVDANTASIPLLARVSGLNKGLAESIVAFRNENGQFINREQFRQISRFGDKTFEQAAGFLRIRAGENPLDQSAVHPEAYPVVQRIVEKTGRPVEQLVGDSTFLRQLTPADFVDTQFGEPTVRDILAELEKPGRDPRPEFRTATFKEGVNEVSDLQVEMVLEGVVTNVTNFGAFVDVGVHQDGLVHVSQLSHKFVRDPHSIVKAGDIVKVKVLEVDEKRKRISLTMRTEPPPPRPKPRPRPRPKEAQAPPQADGDRAQRPPRRERPADQPAAGPRPEQRPRQQERRPEQATRGAERPTERRPERRPERKPDKKPDRKPEEKERMPQTAMAAAFAKVGLFGHGRKSEE
ncbi:MAG: S1 RNA-binding domain-containing protein [Acidobacteria bacterium]|nr:MAG: S1 RNA-binding domain-containing protein [Acidobacteriota bacterium]